MTDMELGAMNAFKWHWPEIELKVCLFHVGQAFFKNLTKHGLKVAYETDEVLRKWFRQVFILSLIPLENVDSYWIDVIMPIMSQLKIKYAKIQGFTEYVLNTYFGGNFLLHVWNHLLFQ